MGVRAKVKGLITSDESETPWTTPMSERPGTANGTRAGRNTFDNGPRDNSVPEATVATFSPNQQTATKHRNRAVVIHQKTPLLISTPPQVTRALAYSHPFILPLNTLAGLITWTTGDPWESFLFVTAFWFFTLYIDSILRWFGPILTIGLLVLGMHSRKYSPLSSSNWTSTVDVPARSRADSAATTRSQTETAAPQPRKSLDEILETLRIFSNRCDVLIDPFMQLTAFLSTQTSATSATTRPALTSLFLRLVAITPIWIILGLPPLRIITTTRLVLVVGTIGLTWHSAPARAARTILWRSHAVRYVASLSTGLAFLPPSDGSATSSLTGLSYRIQDDMARKLRNSGGPAPGIRFTFAVYENQRRWVALGFTSNLFPNERAPWTEEHGNACSDTAHFQLPETGAEARDEGLVWRWVPGQDWRVDPSWTGEDSGAPINPTVASPPSSEGWIYYDNKWRSGSKTDDWSKWTRRRRWIRDAELVEWTPEMAAAAEKVRASQESTQKLIAESWASKRDNQLYDVLEGFPAPPPIPESPSNSSGRARDSEDNVSLTPSMKKKKTWFGSVKRKENKEKEMADLLAHQQQKLERQQLRQQGKLSGSYTAVAPAPGTAVTTANGASAIPVRPSRDGDDDVHTPLHLREPHIELDRTIGEGVAEGLS